MNQNFHTDHFSCWNCETSLTGSRYILKDEHPYCIKCYEELFAHSCEECKKKIGTDSKVNLRIVMVSLVGHLGNVLAMYFVALVGPLVQGQTLA